MKFLNRMRDAMCRFMYGRNGVDSLGWAMVIFELMLSLAASILRVRWFSILAHYATMALWLIVFYRIFSKNLTKRRAENAKFMRWLMPMKNNFAASRARHADKTHKYVKCSCGAWCRVPRDLGQVEITCPKCGKKQRVKT